jgi:hypothetical protein
LSPLPRHLQAKTDASVPIRLPTALSPPLRDPRIKADQRSVTICAETNVLQR